MAGVLAVIAVLPAATGNTIADRELGQPDFVHNGTNYIDAVGLAGPNGVIVDHAGHLYVADTGNSRVLGYTSATSFVNGQPAVLVIGQPDFNTGNCNDGAAAGDVNGLGPDSLCFPESVAVDSGNNLYVSDNSNNRVLEYSDPFSSGKTAGESASTVFGQGSFTAASCNQGPPGIAPTASTLCSPDQIALDLNDNLYVADEDNSRILEYNSPLTKTSVAGSGDTVADLVFGQAGSFTTTTCGTISTPPISATTLCDPEGVTIDSSGNVYISDTPNSRVLEYNTPLTKTSVTGSGDTTADLVFGQAGSFTTGASNQGAGPSATSLSFPGFAFSDPAGHLFVADTDNARVLEYPTPLNPASPAGGTTATVALGQPSLTSSGCHGSATGPTGSPMITASDLCSPRSVTTDSADDVLVGDSSDNRVVFYPAGSTTGASATSELGQANLTQSSVNLTDAKGLILPESVAVDSQGHLYVSDPGNNRVLAFGSAASFSNGASAVMVFGQPDFFSSACNNGTAKGDVSGLGPDSLCNPAGVTVDSKDNLYVSDTDNFRVLVYNTPFSSSSGEPGAGDNLADIVIGESSFSDLSNGEGLCFSSNGLSVVCEPSGLVVDPAGNLFVADPGLNRVTEFPAPLSIAESANGSLIFGQTNSIGSFCNQDTTPGGATLCQPTALALDSAGNLYVADSGNNRVLEYDTPLTKTSIAGSGDTIADTVFGQAGSFTTNSCPSTSTPTATSLCSPDGVAVDSLGNLYISDGGQLISRGSITHGSGAHAGGASGNSTGAKPSYSSINGQGNRVLEFNTPLNPSSGESGAGDTSADRVFGQNGSFTGDSCNGGTQTGDVNGIGPDSLCEPAGLWADSIGNLYIADRGNSRVLEFAQPLQTPTPTATPTATPVVTPTAIVTPTAVVTPSATPTPSGPTGTVKVPTPISVTGSPGQTLSAGQFLVINDESPSGQAELINSITVEVTNPQLLASITLTGGFGEGFQNITVSPVTAQTTFNFPFAEFVPPGAPAIFNLSVTLAGGPTSTPSASPTPGPSAGGPMGESMIPPAPPVGGSGMVPFGVGMAMLGFGLLAIPAQRRRRLLLLACALLLVAASQVGCDPCPACSSNQNVATLTVTQVTAIDENEAPVTYSGLPAGVAQITVQ